MITIQVVIGVIVRELIAYVTNGNTIWGGGASVKRISAQPKEKYLFSICANEEGGPGPKRYFHNAADAVWAYIKYNQGDVCVTVSEISARTFSEVTKQIRDKIETALGHVSEVYYSAYKCDENSNPIDNLSDVPIRGKVRFVRGREYDDTGSEYVSEIIDSPTWLQIAVLADNMINTVNDHHHVFLENVRVVNKVKGVQICHFEMGS